MRRYLLLSLHFTLMANRFLLRLSMVWMEYPFASKGAKNMQEGGSRYTPSPPDIFSQNRSLPPKNQTMNNSPPVMTGGIQIPKLLLRIYLIEFISFHVVMFLVILFYKLHMCCIYVYKLVCPFVLKKFESYILRIKALKEVQYNNITSF